MKVTSLATSMLFSLLLSISQGCKKEEPRPPTTPPPPESQVPSQAPAQPTASTDVTSSPNERTASSVTPSESLPLKAVIPSTTEAAAKAAPDVASGAVDGPKIYQTFCQNCHGPTGAGDGVAAAGLTPKPASFASNGFRLDPNGNSTKGEIDDILAVVHDGAAKYGGSPLMAPWPTLNPEQQNAVAKYVKSLVRR